MAQVQLVYLLTKLLFLSTHLKIIFLIFCQLKVIKIFKMIFQIFLIFFIFIIKVFLNNIYQSNQNHNLKAGNHYHFIFRFVIIILQLSFLLFLYFIRILEFHMIVFLSLLQVQFFLFLVSPNLCSSNLKFLINLLMKFKILLIFHLIQLYIEFYLLVMPLI